MTNSPGSTAAPANSADLRGRCRYAGRLRALACAFRGNFQGATAASWQRHMGFLPDRSVVVDVSTGTGAIALATGTGNVRRTRR